MPNQENNIYFWPKQACTMEYGQIKNKLLMKILNNKSRICFSFLHRVKAAIPIGKKEEKKEQ